jgi:hypothetical protein
MHEAWNTVLLTEAANKSLSRFFRHFANHDIAILTAFRKVDESGNMLTWNDNLIRNKSLKQEIRNAGYGYIQVKGYYPEVNPTTGENEPVYEESLVVVDVNKKVVGNLRDNAIGWGEKWSQDSVIFKPAGEAATLIGTNDTAGWIARGETKVVGKEHWNVPAEIFTKLKGNRQFSFTEEVDVKQYESYMVQSAKEDAMKRVYGKK